MGCAAVSNSQTSGPVTAAVLRELTLTGRRLPNDLLWEEGSSPQSALLASAAIDIVALINTPGYEPGSVSIYPSSPLTPASSSAMAVILPHWLPDVLQAEERRRSSKPERPTDSCRVAAHLQTAQRTGLSADPADAVASQVSSSVEADDVPVVGKLPDWVREWLEYLQNPRKPPLPAVVILPDWLDDVRRLEGQVLGPKSVVPAPDLEQAAASILLTESTPVVNTAAVTAGTGSGQDKLATGSAPSLETFGSQQPNAAQPTDEPLTAIYLRAQAACQAWVDHEDHRSQILAGRFQVVKLHPDIQKIVQDHVRYGPDFVRRLIQYLAFLVDNRRQFYSQKSTEPTSRPEQS